jgi:hypothetical protein
MVACATYITARGCDARGMRGARHAVQMRGRPNETSSGSGEYEEGHKLYVAGSNIRRVMKPEAAGHLMGLGLGSGGLTWLCGWEGVGGRSSLREPEMGGGWGRLWVRGGADRRERRWDLWRRRGLFSLRFAQFGFACCWASAPARSNSSLGPPFSDPVASA